MTNMPAEFLRPRQILKIRDQSGIAFIPFSPGYEWHSYHLPLGTDALIAERLAQAAAERLGALWFRAIPLGADSWVSGEGLKCRDYPLDAKIFGMNLPDLPLVSDYAEDSSVIEAVARWRLKALKGCGFRCAVIINVHGGEGQKESLVAAAQAYDDKQFKSLCVSLGPHDELKTARDNAPRIGGHAGMRETTFALAFCPELVDLMQQPEGDLKVRQTGILYSESTIPPEWNPRRASIELAHILREGMIADLVEMVKEACGRMDVRG